MPVLSALHFGKTPNCNEDNRPDEANENSDANRPRSRNLKPADAGDNPDQVQRHYQHCCNRNRQLDARVMADFHTGESKGRESFI